MTVYVVKHFYDIDAGYDVAIEDDIVAAFETKEEAEEFVTKYSNVHVYDESYTKFRCGELYITPIKIGKYDESEFWWLDEGDDEDDE